MLELPACCPASSPGFFSCAKGNVMIKAVIFDIDNTLYSYDASHPAGMEQVLSYGERELGLQAAQLQALIKKYQKELTLELGTSNAAIHNRALRYQRICEELHLPLSHAARMNRLYWDGLIGASTPEPGAVEAIRSLHEKGYIIGVGTDMTLDFQLEKLEHLGLMACIDFVVSSEEAGAEKPDPKLFELCVRKAGTSPDECLFVGDSLKKDVLGARAAGLKALWYKGDPAQNVPVLAAFDRLEELVPQL